MAEVEAEVEAEIKTAIARASETLHGLRWFELVQTRGHIEDGQIQHFQVTLKVGFVVDPVTGSD